MNDRTPFIDVNIPMCAAGKSHPFKEPCARVLTEIAEGRLDGVIDSEIVQEILYRFGALRQWQMAVQMATSLLDLIPVVLPVTSADAREAIALFAQYGPAGVRARDVIHAAVMRNNGISTIISLDVHFDQIAGIERLDPRDLALGGRRSAI